MPSWSRCLLATCIALTALALFEFAPSAAHAQAPEPCIQIYDVAGLDGIRSNLAGHYCLKNDIDLSGVSRFRPIGGIRNPFAGSLDGGGYTIKNMTIVCGQNRSACGLFGVMSGTVSNLILSDANVRHPREASTGALAGFVNSGEVTNVHSSGLVSGFLVGGLVGQIYNGTITRSSSSASVQGLWHAGGLFVQLTSGMVMDSYATGSVTGAYSAGGLGSAVSGNAEKAHVLRCFATGIVSATGTSDNRGFAGGIVAAVYDTGEISDSYSTSPVNSNSTFGVGGAVGVIYDGSLKRVISVGNVSGIGVGKGGLVGLILEEGRARHSSWDNQASGQTTSALGRGRKTKNLTKALPEGFDPDVWTIIPGESYPYLIGVTPEELIPRPPI